jgi:predicted transcriptional regulator
MAKTSVTLDLDSEAEERLRTLANTRGQEKSRVVADALALLDTLDSEEPDIAEDLRRLETFNRTQMGVPLGEIKDWVRSWGSANELPTPEPRKV